MTKREFEQTAGLLNIEVNGAALASQRKTFSTGSCGWNFNGKAIVRLPNGDEVRVQVSGNAVVIGSKEWSQ